MDYPGRQGQRQATLGTRLTLIASYDNAVFIFLFFYFTSEFHSHTSLINSLFARAESKQYLCRFTVNISDQFVTSRELLQRSYYKRLKRLDLMS